MDISEFFDPKKLDHLRAYEYLSRTGVWPKEFIPYDVTFSSVWQTALLNKLANVYIEEKLH